MPLTALASPGPRVTTTAPGVPVRSAQVAAMIVAAVSPWARTKRRPASAAAPTTSRFGPPPGRPNSSRVPAGVAIGTEVVDGGRPPGAGRRPPDGTRRPGRPLRHGARWGEDGFGGQARLRLVAV